MKKGETMPKELRDKISKGRLTPPVTSKNCKNCGETFYRKLEDSWGAWDVRQCCGDVCAKEAISKSQMANADERKKSEIKQCTGCKQPLPFSEFYIKRKDRLYLSPLCKICSRGYRRKKWLENEFKLTEEGFDKIDAYQNRCCAVCKNPPKKLRLSIDHCHKTGLVRGLLCWRCNGMLGLCRDSVELLTSAVGYLVIPRQLSLLVTRIMGFREEPQLASEVGKIKRGNNDPIS